MPIDKAKQYHDFLNSSIKVDYCNSMCYVTVTEGGDHNEQNQHRGKAEMDREQLQEDLRKSPV